MKRLLGALAVVVTALVSGPATHDVLADIDDTLLQTMIREHRLTARQAEAVSALYRRYLPLWRTSQAVARHPVSEAQCVAEVLDRGLLQRRASDEQICGHPFMVPLTLAGQPATSATACKIGRAHV